MSTNAFGAGAKFKQNTRGLDVISSVYAFAMALGLTDVFVGSKPFISDLIFGTGGQREERIWLVALLLINVVLVGLRFFWVPRNMTALVYKAAECAWLHKDGPQDKLDINNATVAFHLLMIFAHGAVFFLMCGEFKYVAFLASSNLDLDTNLFSGYVLMHIFLLLINAVWIGLIKIQEEHIEGRAGWDSSDWSMASSVWWQNNLLCSLLALAPFSMLGPCGANVTGCQTPSAISPPSPLSAHQLSSIFQGGAGLVPLDIGSPALKWALFILILNSLYDLGKTGRWYLVFEDVEWERRAPNPRGAKAAETLPDA